MQANEDYTVKFLKSEAFNCKRLYRCNLLYPGDPLGNDVPDFDCFRISQQESSYFPIITLSSILKDPFNVSIDQLL